MRLRYLLYAALAVLAISVTYVSAQVLAPNVVGLTRQAAEAAITLAQLVVGDVTPEYSDAAETGRVLRQEPAAGTSANPGDRMDLTLASDDPLTSACYEIGGTWTLNGYPSAVATDASGNVYVGFMDRVEKRGPDGSPLLQWGSEGTGTGQFAYISGLAVDASGKVYVLDAGRGVQKFDGAGGFIREWAPPASGGSVFYSAIAVDPSGYVYVVERNYCRVMKFTTDGEYVTTFATTPLDYYNDTPGSLYWPIGLAADSLGVVHVADYFGLHSYASDGAFRSEFGLGGYGADSSVNAVCVDAAGNLLAAVSTDTPAHGARIAKYSGAWQLLGSHFMAGFVDARGIAADASGQLWVADCQGRQLLKLTPTAMAVPEVAGRTQAEVEAALQAVGLTVGTTTGEFSETVPAGSIVRLEPPSGASIKPGTVVNIVLSLGPNPVLAINDIVSRAFSVNVGPDFSILPAITDAVSRPFSIYIGADPATVPPVTDAVSREVSVYVGGSLDAVPVFTDAVSRAFSVVVPYVDLTVTSLEIDGPVSGGHAATGRWTVTNSGYTPITGAWHDALYWANGQNSGDGTAIDGAGADFDGTLEAGGSYRRTFSLSIPAEQAGQRWLGVRCDANSQAEERFEGNNFRTLGQAVTVQGPDLQVVSVTPGTTTPKFGEILVLQAVIKNNGPGEAYGQWEDAVYLSKDATLGGDDIQVYRTTVAGRVFDANGECHVEIQVNLPVRTDYPTGAYHLFTVTDAAHALYDADFANNALSTPMDITRIPIANLQVSNVVAPPHAVPGEPVQIAYTVTNAGNTPAAAPWKDSVSTPAGTVWEQDTNVTLATGASEARTASFTMPEISGSETRFTVKADSAGAIVEESETDNAAEAAQVTEVWRPDLAVTDVTASPSMEGDAQAAVSYKVRNVGRAQARASWVDEVYLQPEAGGELTLIGSRTHAAALASGAEYGESVSFQVPGRIPPGNYKVIVDTDAGDAVREEGDGANNRAKLAGVTALTQPERPNLVVESVSSPADGPIGGEVSVTWHVRNTGTAAASGGWSDRISVVDATTDTHVSDVDVSIAETVEVSGAYERTATVRYPSTVGQYRVMAVTDRGDAVNEGTGGGERDNVTRSAAFATQLFSVTVNTDLTDGAMGAPVPLHGDARLSKGAAVANTEVEIGVAVRGTTRALRAHTDATGAYTATFEPLPTEAGAYSLSAGPVGVQRDVVQDTFNLWGFLTQPSDFSLLLWSGATERTVTFTLTNPSDQPVTGLAGAITGLPPNVTADIRLGGATLAGAEARSVNVVFAAGDVAVGTFQPVLHLTSAQAAAAKDIPITLTIKALAPVLEALPAQLRGGMLRATATESHQTLVSFEVRNVGTSEARNLHVSLPSEADWMKAVTPLDIAVLAPGAATTVQLMLAPPASLDLGPYAGAIAVAGSGKRVEIPFEFQCVSDLKGTLRVTAKDEASYFGEGTPNLVGAKVRLLDAYTREPLGLETVTDVGGVAVFEGLTEGYRLVEVSAEKHGTYTTTVNVRSGVNEISAFLPMETVRFEWSVIPTGIEDRYDIHVEAIFETNVPAPVVTVTPALIDLDVPKQIDLEVENHGLIAANAARFIAVNRGGWVVEPLVSDLGTLPAKSKRTVPVRIYRAPSAKGSTIPYEDECTVGQLELHWAYVCGFPVRVATPVNMRSKNNPACIATSGGGGESGGGDGGGGWMIRPMKVRYQTDLCECSGAILGCLPIPIPCWKEGLGRIMCGDEDPSDAEYMEHRARCLRDNTRSLQVCAIDTVAEIPFTCLCTLLRDCLGVNSGNGGSGPCSSEAMPCSVGEALLTNSGFVKCQFDQLQGELFGAKESGTGSMDARAKRYDAYFALAIYARYCTKALLTGELEGWFAASDQASSELIGAIFGELADALAQSSESGRDISDAEGAAILSLPRPSCLPEAKVTKTIARLRRTHSYAARGIYNLDQVPAGESTDFVARDTAEGLASVMDEAERGAVSLGFADAFDAFIYFQELLSQTPEQGVCARVKIQIDQHAVLTRAAFKALLGIGNESGSGPIQNLGVSLRITDEAGADATDLFEFKGPVLTGVDALDGTGSIAAGSSGDAEWTIIPGRDAAPSGMKTYRVSGTVQYTLNGKQTTMQLYPTSIDVYPDPSLELDYFVEEMVYGDDPFTDEVEPAVPFSLGLLVHNKGFGTAKDFTIVSEQPKIVDNEKGLLIDFLITGTEVNGEASTAALTASFGDIAPGALESARWIMTASLQGKFINTNAYYEHVTDLGEKVASAIERVDTHMMTHVVRIDTPSDDGKPDFLADDMPDIQKMPDKLYSTTGSVTSVAAITDAALSPQKGNSYGVTLHPLPGHFYVRLDDPTLGARTIHSVRRSDGKEILVGPNAWQTKRVIRLVGQAPRLEARVHLFDYNADTSGAAVSYVVEYSDAVTVPAVVGMAQAAAQAALVSAGLTAGAVTQEYSATVPVGSVISQAPTSGASAQVGSPVALVVSRGPRTVNVPNVVGMAQATAETALTSAGLAVGAVTTAKSKTVPVGSVISQDPGSGTSVAPGTQVALVVSSGKPGGCYGGQGASADAGLSSDAIGDLVTLALVLGLLIAIGVRRRGLVP